VKRAIDIIRGLTAEPEIGATYKGTVKRIERLRRLRRDLPGHRRPRARLRARPHRVENVADVIKEGDGSR
jgi:polyribonucleotide nucleotidyltransferase